MDHQPPTQNDPRPQIPVSQQGAPAPTNHQQYVFMAQPPMVVYPQIAYDASGQPQLVYMMQQQQFQQPFQQPLQHHIVQTLQQPIPHPLQQSFQQPLQYLVQQTFQQPLHQPLQHPIQQPLQQPVQQPIQQPVQQPIQQQPQQPVQQPIQQQLQRPPQQPLQQPIQQPIQQTLKQPIQQQVQQPIQQTLQQPIQQQVQQPIQQTLQQPIQQPFQQAFQQPLPQLLQPPLQQQLLFTNQRVLTQPQHTQQINPQLYSQQISSHPSQQVYNSQSGQQQLSTHPPNNIVSQQQYNIQPVVSSQYSGSNGSSSSANSIQPVMPVNQRSNKIQISSLQNLQPKPPQRLQPTKRKSHSGTTNPFLNSYQYNNVSIVPIQSEETSTTTSLSQSLRKNDKYVHKSTIAEKTTVKALLENSIDSGNMPWMRNSSSELNITKQLVSLDTDKYGANFEVQHKKQKTEASPKGADSSASTCEIISNIVVKPCNKQLNYEKTSVVNETMTNKSMYHSLLIQQLKSPNSSNAQNMSQYDVKVEQNVDKTSSVNLSIEYENLSKSILSEEFTERSDSENINNESIQSPNKINVIPKRIDPIILKIEKLLGKQNIEIMPAETSNRAERQEQLIPKLQEKDDTVEIEKCHTAESKSPIQLLSMPLLFNIDSKDTSETMTSKHMHCNELSTTAIDIKPKIEDDVTTVENNPNTLVYNTNSNLNMKSPCKVHSGDEIGKSSNITNQESIVVHKDSSVNMPILKTNKSNESDIKNNLRDNMEILKAINKSFLSKGNELTSDPSKVSEESCGTISDTKDEEMVAKNIQCEELNAKSSKHITLATSDLQNKKCKKSKGPIQKRKRKTKIRKNVSQCEKLVTSLEITNNEEIESTNKVTNTKCNEIKSINSTNKPDIQSIINLALDQYSSDMKANVENCESALWNEVMLIANKNPTCKICPEHVADLKKALKDYLNSRNIKPIDNLNKSDTKETRDAANKTEANDNIECLKARMARIVTTYKELVSNEKMFKISPNNNSNKSVLTHIVEGHVIQESNAPFPVMKYNQEATSSEARVTRSKENQRPRPEKRSMNPFSGVSQATIHSWKMWDLALHLVKHGWYNTAATLMDHEMDGLCLSYCSREQLLEIGIEKERVDVIISSIDRLFFDTPFFELDI